MVIIAVYLPYYFQAVKGATARQSAIDLFPLTIMVAVSAAVCGVAVGKSGHVWPALVFTPAFAAIG
jgi:MFS transporter, DHA2 family, glioxin efflux transporter